MIASLAAPLLKPLVLNEDGDERSDVPVAAWRDEDNHTLLDENNQSVIS